MKLITNSWDITHHPGIVTWFDRIGVSLTISHFSSIIMPTCNATEIIRLKQKLKNNLTKKQLFNTAQYTKDFENVMEKILSSKFV